MKIQKIFIMMMKWWWWWWDDDDDDEMMLMMMRWCWWWWHLWWCPHQACWCPSWLQSPSSPTQSSSSFSAGQHDFLENEQLSKKRQKKDREKARDKVSDYFKYKSNFLNCHSWWKRFQTRYDLTNEHSFAGDGHLRSSHHYHSDALVQTEYQS